MKTLGKILFALSIVTALTANSSMATDPIRKTKKSVSTGQVTQVRLLPAPKGKIKVLFVNSNETSISVKVTGEEIHFVDHIRLQTASKGFIKTYSFEAMPTGDYSIEISDSSMSVSYQVEKQANDTVFAKYWESFTPSLGAETIIAASGN